MGFRLIRVRFKRVSGESWRDALRFMQPQLWASFGCGDLRCRFLLPPVRFTERFDKGIPTCISLGGLFEYACGFEDGRENVCDFLFDDGVKPETGRLSARGFGRFGRNAVELRTGCRVRRSEHTRSVGRFLFIPAWIRPLATQKLFLPAGVDFRGPGMR